MQFKRYAQEKTELTLMKKSDNDFEKNSIQCAKYKVTIEDVVTTNANSKTAQVLSEQDTMVKKLKRRQYYL